MNAASAPLVELASASPLAARANAWVVASVRRNVALRPTSVLLYVTSADVTLDFMATEPFDAANAALQWP